MKLRKIEKKGILLSWGIRIIIGVLAVLILIYLATQLTGIFTKKSAQAQAKESLKRLVLEIKGVEDGSIKEGNVFIESPNDWWIIAWPYQEDFRKPEQCKRNYCLCICLRPVPLEGTGLPGPDDSLKACNAIGVCEDFDRKTKTMFESAPESYLASFVKWVGENVLGLDVKNIPLDINKPLPIRIKLVNDEIHVIK